MTDKRTPAAHAASQQAGPPLDGVVDREKLPVAESRSCHLMVRKLINALAERGHRDLVTELAEDADAGEICFPRSERHFAFDARPIRVPIAPGNECPAGLAVRAHWHRQPSADLPGGGPRAR